MSTYTATTVPTQFVEANGIRFAYRRWGKRSGVPLVFNQHFTGNLDNWDPAVLDGLAKEREVIIFNNAGVASSSGEVPTIRSLREKLQLLGNRDIDTIPTETMNALTRYSWPGNIRELQNLVERAVILSPGNVLHVPLHDLKHRSASAITSSRQTLAETERAHILAVLEKTKWKLSGPNGAAERLGLSRSTLQFRMKKLGIVRPT
jgi:Bacterial regulatory protein, Fis family